MSFDPRPYAYSAAALAVAGALTFTILSWRQTPDQHRNISILAYNAAVATWNVRQASASASAAVAPLADPRTGLAPSVAQLVASVHGIAQDFSTTSGKLPTAIDSAKSLLDTTSSQIANIGGAVTEIKTALVPDLNSAGTLIQNYSALPDRWTYATRWLWDCTEFSGCLQSQSLALVGSARHALGSFARASDQFPVLVTHFQTISVNLGGFTGSLNHITGEIDKRYFLPKTKKQKIWSATQDVIEWGAIVGSKTLF